eukprot:TRINITY_DN7374_c0_g1_i1.p1 TRINITY_DN7374_c0_g1~~TRINITY_DN7374_c0_g1_i1.p1  ORF type:complete len:390 (+),score=76.36 TRINITY_DN7374_c0_g1_i1:1794-2963(+)
MAHDSKRFSAAPIPPHLSSVHDSKHLSGGTGALFSTPQMPRSSGIVLTQDAKGEINNTLRIYRQIGVFIAVVASFQAAAGVAMVVLSAMIGQVPGTIWIAMPHVPLLASGGAVVTLSIFAISGGLLSNRPLLITYTWLGSALAALQWCYATLLLSLLWHNNPVLSYLSGCDELWSSAQCQSQLANLQQYAVILCAIALATAGAMIGVAAVCNGLAWKIHDVRVYKHSRLCAVTAFLGYAQLMVTFALGTFTVLHTLSVGDSFGFGIVFWCVPVGVSLVASAICIVAGSQERQRHALVYMFACGVAGAVMLAFGIFYVVVAPEVVQGSFTVFQQNSFALYRYYLGGGGILCACLHGLAWYPAFMLRRQLKEDDMMLAAGAVGASPKYRDA